MSARSPRRIDLAGVALALACLSSGCDPELVVGKRIVEAATCTPPDSEGSAGAGSESTIDIGWSTGFESGFCDYERVGGQCYNLPDASYGIVEEPVHGGSGAARFSVTADAASDGMHTRCFLEGTLPPDAVYGAWFFVPAAADNTGNWNLFHFRDGSPPPAGHGLWDVPLGTADDGSLFLYLFDFLNPEGGIRIPDAPLEVPIGAWFHVEFRLRRAADATGEVALRQDGALVMTLTDVITDDSAVTQWYVGNLADALMPPELTIYVDDVSIRAAP